MAITVGEIVKKYLDEHGYDGLCFPDVCSCTTDDLFPCRECIDDCMPGYKTKLDSGEIGIMTEES